MKTLKNQSQKSHHFNQKILNNKILTNFDKY
jgi:hypothetical protein